MKNAVIVVLALAAVFLTDRLARVENQRYVLALGLCEPRTPDVLQFYRCVEGKQSRTSWFWQAYYGITTPIPAVPLSSR